MKTAELSTFEAGALVHSGKPQQPGRPHSFLTLITR